MNLRIFLLFAMFSFFMVASQNPFKNGNFYVNPTYKANLQTSIATASGKAKENLLQMVNVPSAYWIDVKSKITGTGTSSVQGILQDSVKNGNQLVVFIVYDLPNRDCNAKASNGEICCTYNSDKTCNYQAQGDCSSGINEYKTTYIDPLYEVLSQYHEQVPIVLIIEPDSLPNLATNLGNPSCGSSATQSAYKAGISYAISKFQSLKVTMYLDAAHGGWLGWSDNLKKFTKILSELTVDINALRGFSTNVANYQPVGERCPWMPAGDPYRNDYCLNGQHSMEGCCRDPCKLLSQWNPANNEMNYMAVLANAAKLDLGFNPYFVIDSGRNGVDDMRSNSADWCNIRGAGVGRIPTSTTGQAEIDAFYWLKTPGESDGCTQTLPDGSSCPRFDSMCASSDSIGSMAGEPRAPQAGQWFDYQIKQLAENAILNPTKV